MSSIFIALLMYLFLEELLIKYLIIYWVCIKIISLGVICTCLVNFCKPAGHIIAMHSILPQCSINSNMGDMLSRHGLAK